MARQQTLRAVVQWSYDLLFEDERRAFERLSVLTGGFDMAAAEAVHSNADPALRDGLFRAALRAACSVELIHA